MKLSKEITKEERNKMYGQYIKYFKNVNKLMTFEKFLLTSKKLHEYFTKLAM